eukprot:scaffold8108_cov267-Pinguiococcus_pyrenoidosus.AAC.3
MTYDSSGVVNSVTFKPFWEALRLQIRLKTPPDLVEKRYRPQKMQGPSQSLLDELSFNVADFLRALPYVEKVELKGGSKALGTSVNRWETENFPFRMPEDLKAFYAAVDGLKLEWSARLISGYVQPSWSDGLRELASMSSGSWSPRIGSEGGGQSATASDFVGGPTKRFGNEVFTVGRFVVNNISKLSRVGIEGIQEKLEALEQPPSFDASPIGFKLPRENDNDNRGGEVDLPAGGGVAVARATQASFRGIVSRACAFLLATAPNVSRLPYRIKRVATSIQRGWRPSRSRPSRVLAVSCCSTALSPSRRPRQTKGEQNVLGTERRKRKAASVEELSAVLLQP